VKLVVITGGIGCGKSTVSARLTALGADVIDVDVLSRELQQPGKPLFEQIVARWGVDVLDPSGNLDREALGRIVFQDQEQLFALTMLAAPITEDALISRALLHEGTDDVVVLEAAQFRGRQYGMEGIIVVDAPVELAVRRLTESRGMQEADARARIASQLPRDERLAEADLVIDNSGAIESLGPQVARAWAWIRELPDGVPTRLLT
jgi:dephospho-CoA kinase